MDIYELKADAMGAMYDAQYLAKQGGDTARYQREEKLYEKLMYMCEGWCGRETPTEYLQGELWELSGYQARQVRWAIKELGYTLPGMHARKY